MKLPAAQAAVLEAASATEAQTIDRLADETGLQPETVTGAAFALEQEGLVEVTETTEVDHEATDEGAAYVESEADDLPENRLYRAAADLGDGGPVPMGDAIEAAGLDGDAVDVALANYARKGCGTVEGGEVTADPDYDPESDPERAVLDHVYRGRDPLAEGTDDADDGVPDALAELQRRGLVERHERTVRHVVLTDEGVTALMEGVETAESVSAVTPELLTSGEWRDVEFADYNVAADAPEYHGGKVHILRQTVERVKDVLVGLGFKEMEGPHADADFWIHDCLFMPQDHPARTHWDRFALANPRRIDHLPADLVERVRQAHHEGVGEDGEGYHSPWSEDFARAVALRGHTTSLSMRYLSGYAEAVDGELEPPERYFSVEKVYRNDTLDPTHLLEFFQIEGWVMAEDLSVRDLMGTFEEFYRHFGITDVEFKPHYNPYTEPSFELFATHPETGDLMEIGNSGLFRDEVLRPLGVDCDVMAWGLALGRLLMLMYGFEDIRDVHGTLCDLQLLRETEVVY